MCWTWPAIMRMGASPAPASKASQGHVKTVLCAFAPLRKLCVLASCALTYVLLLCNRHDRGAVDPGVDEGQGECTTGRWQLLGHDLACSLIATHWRLQGIGRWTADMFAMFFMGRPGELAICRLKLAIVQSIVTKNALHATEAFFDPHLLRPLQMCCQSVI